MRGVRFGLVSRGRAFFVQSHQTSPSICSEDPSDLLSMNYGGDGEGLALMRVPRTGVSVAGLEPPRLAEMEFPCTIKRPPEPDNDGRSTLSLCMSMSHAMCSAELFAMRRMPTPNLSPSPAASKSLQTRRRIKLRGMVATARQWQLIKDRYAILGGGKTAAR